MQPQQQGLIASYGLFWRADELRWAKARGRRPMLRLWGHRGTGSTLRVADFRMQSGLYVLYGDTGLTMSELWWLTASATACVTTWRTTTEGNGTGFPGLVFAGC
jgi:hypothetical protein